MNPPVDKPAAEFTTLTDNWEGKKFNSPNDAVFSKSGDLFFTDPSYGMEFRYDDPTREMDFTGVFRLQADGRVTLLTDACGTHTRQRQDASLNAIKGYCRQLTTEQLIAEIDTPAG